MNKGNKNDLSKVNKIANGNILLISSSAQSLWRTVEKLRSTGDYIINMEDDYLMLDNGDFATVVKEEKVGTDHEIQ